MKQLVVIIFVSYLVFNNCSNLFGQTFTSNGACNPLDLNINSCWNVTNKCEVENQNNVLPPFANITKPINSCKVNIIINQPAVFNGDLVFGGNFDSLIVEGNGVLTVNGNLSIEGEKTVKVFLKSGGQLNVRDELILIAGSQQKQTIFQINGDSSSFVNVGKIDLRGQARLNIKRNGGLIAKGDTRYNGNSSEINVEGLFITSSLTIQGGNGHRLNVIDQGKVGIEKDLTIGGSSVIDITGTSEIEVGGDLKVDGNSTLNIKGTSKVSVCGERPDLSTGNRGVRKDNNAKYVQSCDFRILPVIYIHFSSAFKLESRTSKLYWSTSKEWENSHFEIERSVDGTNTFVKVGQVSGMGWTDEITEYSFEDDKLPLSGGNIFYRLKQVDFNGRFDYSEITAVIVPNVYFTKGVWRAYPNPTKGNEFNLELVDMSQYQDEAISLRVISSHISSDEKTFHTLQELNQSVAALMANAPAGLWIIEIKWGNKVERIKLMKK